MEIDINEFTSAASTSNNTRIKRTVQTNTNVKNNAILALGGLVRTNSDQVNSDTPVLGKIPIIGWFFKNRKGTAKKTCLTVFIRPTVVTPYNRDSINNATQDYIRVAKQHAGSDGLFSGLRDPITRWFFKDEQPAKHIDQFMTTHHYPTQEKKIKAQERDTGPQSQGSQWDNLKPLFQDAQPIALHYPKEADHPRST